MGFLAPLMLWGSLAASIPIALHFFYRSRYRTIPWAAMKFLLASIEQTSRRMKFQELLLLILRTTLLVLLALALARPISDTVRGAGEEASVDAVFLFDTSMSMGANDGDKTRMRRAQDAALSIIDQLPPHSTVQIITCADRAELNLAASEETLTSPSVLGLLGPRFPTNLDQARTLIEDLKPTSLATDLTDGISLIMPAFEKTKNNKGSKEVYIFTDMQRSAWETRPGDLKDKMKAICAKSTVTVVKCAQQALTNAAIVKVTPQTDVPRPGERVDFAIQVRHTAGKESIKNLQLTLLIDGEQENGGSKSIEELKKGETVSVNMNGKLNKPGLHTVTVLMTGGTDDVPGDNRFDYVLRVPDYFRILLVDGGKYDPEDRDVESLASSYYLAHQMLPVDEKDYAKFHVQLTRVRSKSAAASLLTPGPSRDKLDLCVLANCEAPPADTSQISLGNVLSHEFLDQLKQYVKDGGSLLIYSGDQVKHDVYNEVLGKQYNLLPLPLKDKVKVFDDKAAKPEGRPIFVDRSTFNLPVFRKFKEDKKFEEFNKIKVYRAFEVEESGGWEEPAKDDDSNKKKEERDLTEAEKTKKAEDERRAEVERKHKNATVVLRYNNGWPAVISRKIGLGEVFFITTSAEPGRILDANVPPPEKNSQTSKFQQFTWNNWAFNLFSEPFTKSTLAHLMAGSFQEHNYQAGTTFTWDAKDRHTKAFTLYHPSVEEARKDEKLDKKKDKAKKPVEQKVERLGIPVKDDITGKYFLKANDLYQAGIYHIQQDEPDEKKENTNEKYPLAVNPDLSETETLDDPFDNKALDDFLGSEMSVRHLLAGTKAVKTTGEDRFHREWTLWLLWLLLILAMCEVGLAYWCGRSW